MQSDVWGSISDQGVVTHITGGNFAQSSITINGWLRDFLWAQASQTGFVLVNTASMAEPVKIFHGVWPYGDEVMQGCFSKLGIGRLKGFVRTTTTFVERRRHWTLYSLTEPSGDEVNIKPWEEMVRAIKKEAARVRWEKREPYAYWKGAATSRDRSDLLKCNLSHKHDGNVRLYLQDWDKEIGEGFKHSGLEDQCSHSLVPMQHFWPIRRKKNADTLSLQLIGAIIILTSEYSKLLKFKPTIPPNVQRVCAETTVQGFVKEFMLQSMVKSPSDELPCALTSRHSSFPAFHSSGFSSADGGDTIFSSDSAFGSSTAGGRAAVLFHFLRRKSVHICNKLASRRHIRVGLENPSDIPSYDV
ncbi:hypothetical protein F3Y22_tig00110793pilonHSYRG00042 [Hibiscus syriacus]|uniref:Glycosyl transferase CAP10 domain-containing protein n=1 Tax=Hibiscus syriacus TaxID=106335 RepID=A0A6A2ZQG6_HIBSY|nr:hypothetical protein F3Y22_tig00110793pilonHSYRG00042 [Hibiscus syriacus]